MTRRVSKNEASLSSVKELLKVAGHFLKNRPCFAVHECCCPAFVSESETPFLAPANVSQQKVKHVVGDALSQNGGSELPVARALLIKFSV